ncbi:hypothetical protein BG011_009104 [Mortierella polycephala]|uniref:Zn(2)-C6 fungal-type domain-containing protein n=1 Tax=Mortierella polycephala TaxID=41804 RepID=A0A9P6PPR4_9FUNG|nr:hypothetical protein BG011_009104 [Mortierella polycephala]
MATSTLQLLPSAGDMTQLDPNTLASISGVAYDLKKLKVYSSCLRCRAKKVKCDRKEPCSRCEKHSVECSYRELASVQLDIRQFQRHLNNPKIRKDGAGIITSTATPIITMAPSSSNNSKTTTAVSSSMTPSASAPSPASAPSNHGSENIIDFKDISNTEFCTDASSACCSPASSSRNPLRVSNTTNTPSKTKSVERVRVHKIHRRKPSSKASKDDRQEQGQDEEQSDCDGLRLDMRAISDHVDRVQLTEITSSGKHKQTAHEQDMAEAFGLAAYLKAKEMEISQNPGHPGQTIDYEMELERALAQRMPSSFSRPDRPHSRARKNGKVGYNPATPYARPSYCQLSPISSSSSNTSPSSSPPSASKNISSTAYSQPTVAAQCCCQIAALQGQALGSCPYSNVSHSGYEKPSALSTTSSSQTSAMDQEETTRIAYSPSYSPAYSPVPAAKATSSDSVSISQNPFPPPVTTQWKPSSYSSMLPPPPALSSPSTSSSSYSPLKTDATSPRCELPPIRLPSPLPGMSAYEVGRDDEEPSQIECKYNEPNVDAWDMIEKPISRTIPLTTKRGRSIKMEMGWILS